MIHRIKENKILESHFGLLHKHIVFRKFPQLGKAFLVSNQHAIVPQMLAISKVSTFNGFTQNLIFNFRLTSKKRHLSLSKNGEYAFIYGKTH